MVIRSVGMALIACIVGVGVKSIYTIDSWMALIVCGAILSLVSLLVNVFVFYSKDERSALTKTVKNKIWRNKNGR